MELATKAQRVDFTRNSNSNFNRKNNFFHQSVNYQFSTCEKLNNYREMLLVYCYRDRIGGSATKTMFICFFTTIKLNRFQNNRLLFLESRSQETFPKRRISIKIKVLDEIFPVKMLMEKAPKSYKKIDCY